MVGPFCRRERLTEVVFSVLTDGPDWAEDTRKKPSFLNCPGRGKVSLTKGIGRLRDGDLLPPLADTITTTDRVT